MGINDLIKEFRIGLDISNFSRQTTRVYFNVLNVFSNYMKGVVSITEIEYVKILHIVSKLLGHKSIK